MAAHHFCCCLPIRLGAFLISLVQFLLAGLVAAGIWYDLHESHDLPTKAKVTFICRGVFYTIFCLSSLFGFIGAIRRSASLLKQYSEYLAWTLIIQVILDGLYLWAYFTTPRDDLIKRCINGSTDQDVIDSCNKTLSLAKGWIIASLILSLLVQAYAAYIVHGYSKKLEVEVEFRTTAVQMDTSYKYNAAPRQSQEALTGAGPHYPYADPSHSFGAGGAPYDPYTKV
ncbi:hypothetical protein EWM64_g1131 [Hericium alpestre]|uniref:MARVEL domain-containing protein n=1 Tax=Hericium alpestre TaxID=135208 RepID=A0A4Z0A7Z7_9AGAM|nr:hypothetical protein EWM64_g1131 [Hericium alpestre]